MEINLLIFIICMKFSSFSKLFHSGFIEKRHAVLGINYSTITL